jgi:hypothetical protein
VWGACPATQLFTTIRFYEAESQIPGPYSRILLRLPARRLKGTGSVTLVVRFVAVDAADHQRALIRSVVLRRR